MRDTNRNHTRAPLPSVAEACDVVLMGQPTSWDCHGGKPLGVIPDKVLRKARAWFHRTATADAGSATAVRMKKQCAAIDVVLADRAKHAPQMELLPEVEQGERGTGFNEPGERDDGFDALIARIQQPDTDDGLPF